MSKLSKHLLPMPTPRGPDIADNDHLTHKELANAKANDGATVEHEMVFAAVRSHELFAEINKIEVTPELSAQLEEAFADVLTFAADRLAKVDKPPHDGHAGGPVGPDTVYLPYTFLTALAMLSSTVVNIGQDMSVTERYQLAADMVREWAAMGAFSHANKTLGMAETDIVKLPSVRGCVMPPSLAIVASLSAVRRQIAKGVADGRDTGELIQEAVSKARNAAATRVGAAMRTGAVPGEPEDDDDRMMF